MKILTSLLSASIVLVTSHSLSENNFHYDYATVLQSKPVYRIVEVTKEERKCRTEEVVYQQRHKKASGGSLIGGILGAAVGHAIGHNSKHRSGATVAGALVGASIGGDSNRNHRVSEKKILENHCRLVPTSWEEERIIGYNVVYRYNGRTFETRLPFEPSDSLKIRVVMTPIEDNTDKSE